mmetsp:Transcript_21251/g.42565  ORF Transcript_21251/g.42565 Transcript_21251/m.42565 type:complete len:960 (+) Transcript_21251:446-3325(+)
MAQAPGPGAAAAPPPSVAGLASLHQKPPSGSSAPMKKQNFVASTGEPSLQHQQPVQHRQRHHPEQQQQPPPQQHLAQPPVVIPQAVPVAPAPQQIQPQHHLPQHQPQHLPQHAALGRPAPAGAPPPVQKGAGGDGTGRFAGSTRFESEVMDMKTGGHGGAEAADIVERSPGGRYLRFNERLGSGAYKDVFRAYDTAEGIEVAWNLVGLSGVPAADKARIINEVRLLEDLNHQNIISFYGSWVNREKEQVIFVTEILSSGTLKSFIRKVQIIRWKVVKRWAVQILRGLQYLHNRDPPVIHRDLKCDNIFINGTSGDLRIGDLGLSTVIPSKNQVQTLSVLGTPEFMAPELYDENYDEKIDIYAFGMCLLEMVTKENPYIECANAAQVYKKVINTILPNNINRIPNEGFCEFIKLCLSPDPNNRPGASDLLQHPILKESEIDDVEVILKDPMHIIGENMVAENTMNGGIKHFEEGSGERRLYTMTTKNKNMTNKTEEMLLDMQESELKMKTVNVLMGRPDKPFDEKESAETFVQSNVTDTSALLDEDSGGTTSVPESAVEREDSMSNLTYNEPYYYTGSMAYRVHAGAQESTDGDSRFIILTITMPVDGEDQQVQFDFDLESDDPVKVAREMEEELNVPEKDVQEISKIIEMIVETARKRPSVTDITISPNTSNDVELNAPFPASLGQPQVAGPFRSFAPGPTQLPSPVSAPSDLSLPSMHVAPGISSSVSSPTTSAPVSVGLSMPKANLPPKSAPNLGPGVASFRSAPLLQKPIPTLVENHTIPVLPRLAKVAVPVDLLSDPHEDLLFFPPAASTSNAPGSAPQSGIAAPITSSHVVAPNQTGVGVSASKPVGRKAIVDANDCDSDCSDFSEMQKLESEFQRKMLHAKAAFEKRIENLHKSREDREAQHKMTLEKHQKELADFEKRLKQAEDERRKRLEQLEYALKDAKKKRKEEKKSIP